MELYSFLEEQCCYIGLKSKNKADVLKELAEVAVLNSSLDKSRVDEIANALKKRESDGSTGFGDGIAIPHASLPNLNNFVLVVATHPDGVEFEAIDKKKVHLFVVILGPVGEVGEHLKILTAVSRGLTRTNAKKEIFAAKTSLSVYEAFTHNLESIGEGSKTKETMKFFVLVLFLEEYLYDILEIFIEKGIEGANVFDSVGMGEYISNVPIFASFIGFLQQKKNHSKTIFAMVPERIENELIEGIETVVGNLDENQGAMIFSTKVDMYKGNMKIV